MANGPPKRHVEVAAAAELLPALIAAAYAGERVFLDNDGVPQVQLVVVSRADEAYLEERWERKFGADF